MLRIVRAILFRFLQASLRKRLKISRPRFALRSLYLESFRVALLFTYQGSYKAYALNGEGGI